MSEKRKPQFRLKAFTFLKEVSASKQAHPDKSSEKRLTDQPFLSSESNFSIELLDQSRTGYHNEDYIQDFPPNSPYIGNSPTICHLLRKKTNLCCLKLREPCEHTMNKCIADYKWRNKTIILAAEYATMAIYNFIVPLRSYFLKKHKLNPILLLLDNEPDEMFLEVIKVFPMVYWMKGSIDK